MSAQKNKNIARRFFAELWEKGDLAVADEIFADDYDHRDPARLRGAEGEKQLYQSIAAAFSEIRITVEDQIAEGDKVVSRCTSQMKHTGTFMGIAATGKFVTFTEIVIHRIVDDKIVEAWGQVDMLGLLQQIG